MIDENVSTRGIRTNQDVLSEAGIHKACLYEKTDSFQTLLKDAFLPDYLTFYRTGLTTRTVQTS